MKYINPFEKFTDKSLNENLLKNLFKNKSAKIKELEEKYCGETVSFKLKTTNSRGIEIPSNTIRFRSVYGNPISNDGTLTRKIANIYFSTPTKRQVIIKFESPTGEHILFNSSYGDIVYLDGIGEYAYMFGVLDPGDLTPIIEDIIKLKLIF